MLRNIFRKLIFLTLAALASLEMSAAFYRTAFAILIDAKSYEMAREQVEAYASEVAKTGLQVKFVVDYSGNPDSLRTELKRLYNDRKCPVEGAVLIGDIPVVMVRDAQHLTSAFKMDQNVYDRWESSVPSDRFYDDFDLEFSLLGKDQDRKGIFYYSLTAGSEQKTRPDIYSGRIRPSDSGGVSRYDKLKSYLEKAVNAKRHPEPVDQILFFSGNGFISESMVARIDEKQALLEHFPWLRKQSGGISYIDHKREEHIKGRLMNEMQRKDLDYAVLHHHGDWNTQYLNNLPLTGDTGKQVGQIKLYLRESLRHAGEHNIPADSARARIERRYGEFPDSWYSGIDDKELRVRDSVYLSDLDLYLSDFKEYRPECRVVSLDACFNGSFHRDSSIASSYIFSEGGTIAVIANSVNVLQDKWVDRYTGLLGLGMNIGNISKYAPYLEQHIIGDPTFAFVSADRKVNVNRLLRDDRLSEWKRLSRDGTYPALQAFAIEQLFRKDAVTSDELLDMFATSGTGQVRMQALLNLMELRDDNFIKAVSMGLSDSYEMVERFSANILAKSGDERLIPAMISAAVRNNTSERVEFALKQAMPVFPKEKMIEELEKQFSATNYMNPDRVKDAVSHSICVNAGKWCPYMSDVTDHDREDKSRLQDIRMMRNYHIHYMVPELLEYMKTCGNPAVQQAMLEAFGWFTLSVQRPAIIGAVKEMYENESLSDDVRNEALKTYNRLK